MKLTMNRDALASATSWVAATAVPARPAHPVSAGILLTAHGSDSLHVAAFDYETSAVTVADAEVGEPDRVLVAGRLLAEVLKALPARQQVTLAGDGTRLTITAGSAAYRLMMLPADEYPQLPQAGEHSAGFDGQQLAAAVAWTTPFAGKDDTLPVLTCVQVTLDGNGTATLVATDRYRLAVATCPYDPGPTAPGGPVLLPARQLAAIPKARRPADEDYILLELAGGDVAGIDLSSRHVTLRPTAGQYPDYRKHVPDPAKVTTTVTASIAPLAAAVKRAAIVAERNTPVRLRFEAGEARLESGTGDEAGYADTIAASIDGDRADVAFNPAYLLEALAATAATGAASACIALGVNTPAFITPAEPEVPGRRTSWSRSAAPAEPATPPGTYPPRRKEAPVMANEPVITVTGNLTGDPELKFTQSGKAVASFTIANTPRYPDQATGQWKDHETWFVPCTAWDTLAENSCETLRRGMAVVATGRLRARTWDDPNGGGKRSRVEMTIDAIGPDLRRNMARVTKVTRERAADDNAASVSAQQQPAPASTWEVPPKESDQPPF